MKLTKIFFFFIHSYCFLFACAFIFSLGINQNYPIFFDFSTATALAILGVYNAHRLLKFHQEKLTREMNDWLSNNLFVVRCLVALGLEALEDGVGVLGLEVWLPEATAECHAVVPKPAGTGFGDGTLPSAQL